MMDGQSQTVWDSEFPTVRGIQDPFEHGAGTMKFEELVSRMEDAHLEPEEIVLRGIAVLKQFAAQHIEDLDGLTVEVARIWSRVERHHHGTRLQVVEVTYEKRALDFILEKMTDAWFAGRDLSPIRTSRPDIWPEWEHRERHLENEFGDLRRLWAGNRQG